MKELSLVHKYGVTVLFFGDLKRILKPFIYEEKSGVSRVMNGTNEDVSNGDQVVVKEVDLENHMYLMVAPDPDSIIVFHPSLFYKVRFLLDPCF